MRADGRRIVVVAGLPKAGTTLPLALLDDHPNLLVFPEELRFFHSGAEHGTGEAAAERLLANANIQKLKLQKHFFAPGDYMEHQGTGFGQRDYSAFSFDTFEHHLRDSFRRSRSTRERILGVIEAFHLGLGRGSLPESFTFVCKAPHNELYADKWVDALEEDGRYVVAVRRPTEHYVSLANIANLQGKRLQRWPSFVNLVNERRHLWSRFPAGQTFVIDYDSLLTEPQSNMTELAEFLEIEFIDSMLCPSKMGVPWAGNSSRGTVEEAIYANPHVAHERLSPWVLTSIEVGLADFYDEMGWQPQGSSPIARWSTRPLLVADRAIHAPRAAVRTIRGVRRRLSGLLQRR